MALLFDGANDYASAAVDLSAESAITLAWWMYWDAFANNDDLAFEYSVNYNSNAGSFIVDPNASTGRLDCAVNGNVGKNYGGYSRPSGAAWHHYMFVADFSAAGASAGEVALYIDGSAASETVVLSSENTGNFGNHTLYFMSRAGASLFGAGRMAEVGLYSGALNAGDAKALASGLVPSRVKPGSLLHYWDMVNGATKNQMGGAALTVSGAIKAEHPRIVRERPRNRWRAAATGGGFLPAWARQRSAVIGAGMR